MTTDELVRQKQAQAAEKPAGEHVKRLRKSAKSADKREGISLKGLSREERRRLLSRAA